MSMKKEGIQTRNRKMTNKGRGKKRTTSGCGLMGQGGPGGVMAVDPAHHQFYLPEMLANGMKNPGGAVGGGQQGFHDPIKTPYLNIASHAYMPAAGAPSAANYSGAFSSTFSPSIAGLA